MEPWVSLLLAPEVVVFSGRVVVPGFESAGVVDFRQSSMAIDKTEHVHRIVESVVVDEFLRLVPGKWDERTFFSNQNDLCWLMKGRERFSCDSNERCSRVGIDTQHISNLHSVTGKLIEHILAYALVEIPAVIIKPIFGTFEKGFARPWFSAVPCVAFDYSFDVAAQKAGRPGVCRQSHSIAMFVGIEMRGEIDLPDVVKADGAPA